MLEPEPDRVGKPVARRCPQRSPDPDRPKVEAARSDQRADGDQRAPRRDEERDKTRDSPNASAKAMGAAQASCAATNSTIARTYSSSCILLLRLSSLFPAQLARGTLDFGDQVLRNTLAGSLARACYAKVIQ